MDINLVRSLLTVLMFVTFSGICILVFSKKRKTYYEDAANLPFADDDQSPNPEEVK